MMGEQQRTDSLFYYFHRRVAMRTLHCSQRDLGTALQDRAQVPHPSFEDGPVTSCLRLRSSS